MKIFKLSILHTLLSFLLLSDLSADCSFELFSISSTKGTKIIDFVEQLSDECEFTVIVTDPNAEEFLNRNLNKTHLKNLTIDEVFNIILNENNLSYRLENNILRISYLSTKVFSIDYILSTRKSTGSTNIMLSSGGIDDANTESSSSSSGENTSSSSSSSESGIKIETTDEVKFWEELDQEFKHVINRPHDAYKADAPIINKNAGLITVTATVKQMDRFEKYLKRLQKKVQLQVLIDVQILAVTMNEGRTTGVDWSQLYALQNLNLALDQRHWKNVTEYTEDLITTGAPYGNNLHQVGQMVTVQAKASLNEVIKFLDTQGDVSSISNPKVLTLNNQPALITVGTEYFYKLTQSTQQQGTGGGVAATTENDAVQSVFAGVLLEITPEISEDKTITLKVNPSVSETTQDMSTSNSADRQMPPDLDRRQLSSVVTVKDGNRVILGGLINTKTTENSNQVPILGNIPVLGYLFSYEETAKNIQELIIIIEPHIIDKSNSKISLKDLGYKGLTDTLLESNTHVSNKLNNVNVK